jgi:SAM-dependent methyltransferase
LVFGSLFRRFRPAKIPNRFGYKLFHETFTEFLDKFEVDGPICHVGSKSKPDKSRFRALFSRCANAEFVGIDIFAGYNVDVVADICVPDFLERHPQLKGHFNFVYCSALLEHVQNPFAAAVNIRGLLKPGGQLFFTGPWVQGYHPYPDDYWRISFSGLKVLFPDIEWRRQWYAGDHAKYGIEFDDPNHERKVFLIRGSFGYSAPISDRALPYLMISAIGAAPLA